MMTTTTKKNSCHPTVEDHVVLGAADDVGGHARVRSEVRLVDDLNAEVQRQRVIALVVRFDAVLEGTGQPPAVLLPIVDRLRVGGDHALEDRLASDQLTDTPVRQDDLRSN